MKTDFYTRALKMFSTLALCAVAVGCASGSLESEKDVRPTASGVRPRNYGDIVSGPLTESWNAQVRAQAERLNTVFPQNLGGRVTVKVQALVLRDGKIQKVSVVESSGVKLVDEAALQAFRAASPLPPPPARVLRHGTVKFAWAFNLSK